MALTREQILTEVQAWDVEDRYELFRELDDLNEKLDTHATSPEFLAELRRRLADLDSGRTKPIPLEQVIQELEDRRRR